MLREVVFIGAVAGLVFASPGSDAEDALPPAEAIVQNVNDRDDGETLSRTIAFQLTDKRGKTREQQTKSFRRNYDGEKRSVIFYTDPKNVEGTAFLTYDYHDPNQEDVQWLYLPAMRKVRRISSANHGDYFLGTDFTYYDIKHESDLAVEDFSWTTLRQENENGADCFVIEAVPRTPKIADELGYSRVHYWIEQSNWMQRKAEFWDIGGNPLKTIQFNDVREVDGIWTAHELVANNHKTGHSTVLKMSDIDYESGVDDDLFTERALKRGL